MKIISLLLICIHVILASESYEDEDMVMIEMPVNISSDDSQTDWDLSSKYYKLAPKDSENKLNQVFINYANQTNSDDDFGDYISANQKDQDLNCLDKFMQQPSVDEFDSIKSNKDIEKNILIKLLEFFCCCISKDDDK